MQIKAKLLISMLCISCLMLSLSIVFALQRQDVGSPVRIVYEAPFLETGGEIWDTSKQSFTKAEVNYLLKTISGDYSESLRNMTKLKQLATAGTTAEQMREFGVNKIPGEDITITLGGLKWTVTYLSTDKNGDPILTLWLDNCVQDAWMGRPTDEGEYYGFLNGGLYSDWTANWTKANTGEKFPSNMYGASYIRAVTLNNGGLVATSGTESKTYEQDPNNIFALFTMDEYGFTQYLDTPSQVQWQEYGQNYPKTWTGHSLPNENWSDNIPNTGSYEGADYDFKKDKSGVYGNYAGKEYNNTWANDYLWLPSISEVGEDNNGIWNTSDTQRINEPSYEAGGEVGKISGSAYNFIWLRSGSYGIDDDLYYTNYGDTTELNYSYAVRPALHLNLKKIVTALGGSI